MLVEKKTHVPLLLSTNVVSCSIRIFLSRSRTKQTVARTTLTRFFVRMSVPLLGYEQG